MQHKFDEACDILIKEGRAQKVADDVIKFIGTVDADKQAEVEESYAEGFHQRWLERSAKEREAENKLRDFVITY